MDEITPNSACRNRLFHAVAIPLFVGLLASLAPRFADAQSPDYDVLIRGGHVIDGTGSPARGADVGIRNATIAAVGDLSAAAADRTIDASGLVVAPGFIDVHTHVAYALTDSAKRLNEAFLRQGVTTVVGGPDGAFSPGMIRLLLPSYKKHGIGTNIAFYVGHNGVRLIAMGEVGRPLTVEKVQRASKREESEIYRRSPTDEEMEQMKALVQEGMEMGAVGLSTGLMYPPGMFATTEEVATLARATEPYGGIYDTHVRDPVRKWLASHQEAINIGEKAGVPVKFAHLKAVGKHNTSKVDSLIRMVEAARKRGVQVVSDQYPYDAAGQTRLKDLILVKKNPAQNEKLLADRDTLATLLSSSERRRRIKKQSEQGIDGGFSWIKAVGYQSLRITRSSDYPELVGKYLSEIAEDRGTDPFDLVADLYVKAEAPVDVKGGVEEETVRKLLRQPWNMVASDGRHADSTTNAHPRSTGTFPRVLGHYVRDLGVLSLEEAIRKMTSFPADFLGLSDRGRLQEGAVADIVVFDPETVDARSTYERPNAYATGVRHVLVNGVPALLEGELTGQAPGRFIRQQR